MAANEGTLIDFQDESTPQPPSTPKIGNTIEEGTREEKLETPIVAASPTGVHGKHRSNISQGKIFLISLD